MTRIAEVLIVAAASPHPAVRFPCVLQEFNLAANIHYCLLQNAASEQSSRMGAMENATKNANEMIDKLDIKFNRTRQAVITTELIEIISGASAME